MPNNTGQRKLLKWMTIACLYERQHSFNIDQIDANANSSFRDICCQLLTYIELFYLNAASILRSSMEENL